MIQKIKTVLLSLSAAIFMAVPAVAALPLASASAAGNGAGSAGISCATSISSGINGGINAAANGTTDCTSSTGNTVSLADIASKVVNILSVVVGVVAVIMIIVGGFRYITSGGESGNVSGAKNTLIYAIVGLVIVALAQFIVHFVLSNVTS